MVLCRSGVWRPPYKAPALNLFCWQLLKKRHFLFFSIIVFAFINVSLFLNLAKFSTTGFNSFSSNCEEIYHLDPDNLLFKIQFQFIFLIHSPKNFEISDDKLWITGRKYFYNIILDLIFLTDNKFHDLHVCID